jgi:predicted protein tyrosine phosphatase
MIIVCPLNVAPELVRAHGPSHAISLLSPDSPWPVFPQLPSPNHLKLSFHDVVATSPGLNAPRLEDAAKLVQFIRDWDRKAPLLIHCWAGISRSTAAAFTAMCLLRDEDEQALADELREASPSATPNRLIISHVDQLLGRSGRMLKAVEAIGRGADAFEGRPFSLEI